MVAVNIIVTPKTYLHSTLGGVGYTTSFQGSESVGFDYLIRIISLLKNAIAVCVAITSRKESCFSLEISRYPHRQR